jgi:hypothetical protein
MVRSRVFAERALTVQLDGTAAKEYTASVIALFLAEEVSKFWSAPGRVPT